MIKCLFCKKEIKLNLFSLFVKTYCENCNRQFEVGKKVLMIRDIKVYNILIYNDYGKQFLYQYKQLGNEPINIILLPYIFNVLEQILDEYGAFDLTFIPTTEKKYAKRHFDTLGSIAGQIKQRYLAREIHVVDDFIRVDDEQQGKKTLIDRAKTKHQYFKKSSTGLKTKNLVVIDDVLTTGTTAINFFSCFSKSYDVEKKLLLSLFISKNLL